MAARRSSMAFICSRRSRMASHLHLVEQAGDLFAVAGDERHGGALGDELGGGGDLVDLEV
jgi:hypothetical protein